MQLSILLSNVCLYAVTVREVTREEALRVVMWWLVISGLVQAFLVGLFYLFNGPITVFADYSFLKTLRVYVVSTTGFLDDDVIRRGKALTWPHETGLIMGLSAMAALALAVLEKSLVKRTLLGAAIVIFFTALFSTKCRGPVVASAGGFLFLCLANVRLRRKALILLSALLLVGAATFVLQEKLLNYGAGITVEPRILKVQTYSSNQIRFTWWTKSLRETIAGGLLGLGPGGVPNLLNLNYSHSLYFSVFFELGLAGAVLFLWMLSRLLALTLPLLRRQESLAGQAHLLFFTGLMTIAVHMLIDLDYNRPVLWLYLALVVASAGILKEGAAWAPAKETDRPAFSV